MLPIAASAAESENIALEKMAFLLMLAASASFMSPFGYQTNLMVYGPGGYVFADFIKFGFPMQITLLIVSIVVLGVGDDAIWIPYVVIVVAFVVVVVATTVGFRAAWTAVVDRAARSRAARHRRRGSDIEPTADVELGGAIATAAST